MTAQQWMLDTNTVSHIVKGHPQVMMRLGQTAMADVCISVITEAELLFGLARRPDATRLHRVRIPPAGRCPAVGLVGGAGLR